MTARILLIPEECAVIDRACRGPVPVFHFPFRLLVFVVVETGSEIIDIDIVGTGVVVVRAEDLSRELLLQRLLSAFRPEHFAASSRLGVRTEILSCRPVALCGSGIGEIGRRSAHWRRRRP